MTDADKDLFYETSFLTKKEAKPFISKYFKEIVDTRSFLNLQQMTKYRRQLTREFETERELSCEGFRVVPAMFRLLVKYHEMEKLYRDEILNQKMTIKTLRDLKVQQVDADVQILKDTIKTLESRIHMLSNSVKLRNKYANQWEDKYRDLVQEKEQFMEQMKQELWGPDGRKSKMREIWNAYEEKHPLF